MTDPIPDLAMDSQARPPTDRENEPPTDQMIERPTDQTGRPEDRTTDSPTDNRTTDSPPEDQMTDSPNEDRTNERTTDRANTRANERTPDRAIGPSHHHARHTLHATQADASNSGESEKKADNQLQYTGNVLEDSSDDSIISDSHWEILAQSSDDSSLSSHQLSDDSSLCTIQELLLNPSSSSSSDDDTSYDSSDDEEDARRYSWAYCPLPHKRKLHFEECPLHVELPLHGRANSVQPKHEVRGVTGWSENEHEKVSHKVPQRV